MEREFVEYAEALELKKLGFNKPCFGYYSDGFLFNCSIYNGNMFKTNNGCLAPLYQQAFRFFRNEHKLITYIGWVYKKTKGIDWFFNIKGIEMINNNVLPHNEIRFNSYEEAELVYLKKLISIVKEKQL